MSLASVDPDPAFTGIGKTSGLDIWCVEDLQLVPVARSSYGKFYSGSAYVVLNTTLHKSGSFHYDIHYWFGTDANQEDLEAASNKALELDHFLGSCAVQYREVQGQETEKFLSYFKPCIIPLEGTYCSNLGHLRGEGYHISLFACKGEHAIRVKEVPFARSSLNHDDVLILDTISKIFLFSGSNSSVQERAKALEVVQFIKDSRHNGKCEVATIEDGKFVGHADVGEFWSFFGGYTPISRSSESAFSKPNIGLSTRMYRISTQGKLCEVGSGNFDQEILKSDQCYMLDSENDIFVWMGRSMSMTERKTAISAAEDFLRGEERSGKTHVTLLAEGLETANFRSFFVNWPENRETKLYEEGRGKVAAMFKRHGYDVKELPEEECDPLINRRGTLKVFLVNNRNISLLEVPDPIKLYSERCYLVQYTYSIDGKDETLLYAWFGSNTSPEDRADAISHMISLADFSRGSPTLAQVFQENEPEQFFQILQTVIIKKGNLEKEIAADEGISDADSDVESSALFRVQGRSPSSMQAVQVDPVSRSLNSSYCYILQTGSAVWSWIGTLSSARDHELLDRIIELLNPLWQPVSVKEGSEPDKFWEVLGGKADYAREKEFKQGIEDPHLFKTTLTKGDLKVEEIYNFTQGDLTTEDVLVLSCPHELYVWIGSHSNITTIETSFTLGQKFLKMDVLAEGLNSKIPMYVVTEGHETSFFTRFFSWDTSKANMHGNSFERKLAVLKGNPQLLEVHTRSSWTASSRATTPDSLRSSPISSDGQTETRKNFSNFSPSVTSRQRLFSSPTATVTRLFPGASPQNGSYGSPMSQLKSNENIDADEPIETDPSVNSITYPYERLKIHSEDPVTDIDVTRREAYLSEEEFQEKVGMRKAAFYGLPKWRRDKIKKSVHLF